jgi:nucleotide-binding universal stress UspA family protein
MKKFIAAFDGLRFCESTLQYAISLSRHANAHLVGVFLDDFTRRSYGVLELAKYEGAAVDQHMQELDQEDEAQRMESAKLFQHACLEAGISFSLHHDQNIAIQELLRESVYADLLVIGEAETLTRFEEEPPTRFIRELLNDVQCPVVLVPAKMHAIQKIILLYDGEPSSVHAARTFSYLFDSLKHLDTEVLTVKHEKENVLLPDERLIKEFITQHFPLAEAIVLKGEPENVISHYLGREKKHALVVLGAYQRSRFSRVFKPSMADALLKSVDLPLFVAHNKS